MNAVHKLSLAVIAAGLVALLGGVRFRLWELTPGSEEYKRNDRRYWTLFKYLGFSLLALGALLFVATTVVSA
jgi:hypothetical protein